MKQIKELPDTCLVCGLDEVKKIKVCKSKDERILIGLCEKHKHYSDSQIKFIVGQSFRVTSYIKIRVLIAAFLFGFGLTMGFIPIVLASILINHNLFIEIIDRMDSFWNNV